MAAPSDITAILAALAARPSATPSQTPQQPPPTQQPPSQGLPPGFPPGALQNPSHPAGIPGFNLPHPTSSGSLDLSAIRPTNSGSVSIQDALAKARGFAAEKGLAYDAGRSMGPREDPRLSGRPYRRSRSRSPPRRDNMRDSYNPYRDERREDPRRGGAGYGRDRSRSPRGRNTFSPPRGYGTRDRSPPPNDNSEVVLIDSSLVGLVIGRQGESLRRIEQESGTRIQFITGPDNSGPQRQCRITGSPHARIAAKREINRIIEENGGNPARETGRSARGGGAKTGGQSPALRDGEQTLQIMVPDRTVGLIIGRGGETIRDLQERSGCHVNIVGENKSVNGLRPVNLIGSPAASARAKELILEIVDSDTKVGEGPSNANNPPSNNRREPFDPFSGGANKINDTILVPSDAVGMIIGKGGETIKEMQSTTGCKINVSQASGADIEREIGLVGTRQAIEDAKKAIWDKVDSVREKNGGGYGGNKRGGARDNGSYSDYSHQQQPSYGQSHSAGQNPPQAQINAPPQGEAGAADPYAIYGGYQNYLAMWYSSFAQQQAQQQAAGGQGEQQRPPGA
ncbi:uncharacterized protein BDR25DRAFT_319985 [Lindgomyces ingoldianus]|uniref:Uncharacterized protein n=1 Tax=Lindgomyces ingoldianus TaxID=673940 RepID=A0ACB6Q982_9PLEO|nr:uncharacterized protein BDR25DRAFT_319985 [Lindgomyces ingoldianus]KAF2463471.1 hypothetical protein BDR25DRAFT_319985 [Lindgomyces ingoldianus]